MIHKDNTIYIKEVLNLNDLTTTIYMGHTETVIKQEKLTPDEIFDRYQDYLTKTQIRNLFKNNE